MKELVFQREVRAALVREGAYAVAIGNAFSKGVPDMLVFTKRGPITVECKVVGAKSFPCTIQATPHQQTFADRANVASGDMRCCYLVYSVACNAAFVMAPGRTFNPGLAYAEIARGTPATRFEGILRGIQRVLDPRQTYEAVPTWL